MQVNALYTNFLFHISNCVICQTHCQTVTAQFAPQLSKKRGRHKQIVKTENGPSCGHRETPQVLDTERWPKLWRQKDGPSCGDRGTAQVVATKRRTKLWRPIDKPSYGDKETAQIVETERLPKLWRQRDGPSCGDKETA